MVDVNEGRKRNIHLKNQIHQSEDSSQSAAKVLDLVSTMKIRVLTSKAEVAIPWLQLRVIGGMDHSDDAQFPIVAPHSVLSQLVSLREDISL
jgi:hypothetical protein